MIINDLNLILYFKSAAEALNYTKAAQILGCTPSTVKKNVRALEIDLNIKLFTRKFRGLALTSEGKILFDRVKKGIKEFELAEKEIGLREHKTLASLKILTTPGQAAEWVYKCLPIIKQEYPDTLIELHSSNLDFTLEENDFDIYVGPQVETSNVFSSKFIATAHFKIYAGEGYLEKHGTPKDRSDLASHKLIKFSGQLQAYFSESNKIFSDLDDDQHYAFVIDSYLAEYNLVRENQGIACLCQEFVATRNEGLVDVFPNMKSISTSIYMVYNNKLDAALVSKVLQMLTQFCIYPTSEQ